MEPDFYTLDVVSGGLGWLSENQRLHWRVKAQRVAGWRLASYLTARMHHLPPIGRARVVCFLCFADARRRDPNNWAPTAKACVDGLVDAGVFPDDDHLHVIGPDMRLGPKVAPKFKGCQFHIYPLENR